MLICVSFVLDRLFYFILLIFGLLELFTSFWKTYFVEKVFLLILKKAKFAMLYNLKTFPTFVSWFRMLNTYDDKS